MTLQEYINLGISTKFPYIVIDNKNKIEISIGIENRTLYISFLGTVSMKDLLHTLMFWKKPYKRMKNTFYVHAGFLRIYKKLQPIVHNWIKDFNKFDNIIISGHSLGGAIATLCREDIAYLSEEEIKELRTKNTNCIISGTPRVFSIFKSSIPRKRCFDIIRIIYKGDIIPSLPPKILGYTHIGVPYQFGKRDLNIFHPKSFYYHYVSLYKNVYDTIIKSNSKNNKLYKPSIIAYSILYSLLTFLGLLIFIL